MPPCRSVMCQSSIGRVYDYSTYAHMSSRVKSRQRLQHTCCFQRSASDQVATPVAPVLCGECGGVCRRRCWRCYRWRCWRCCRAKCLLVIQISSLSCSNQI